MFNVSRFLLCAKKAALPPASTFTIPVSVGIDAYVPCKAQPKPFDLGETKEERELKGMNKNGTNDTTCENDEEYEKYNRYHN